MKKKMPFFNAPRYLHNKTQIRKVDEIFGPINESVSSLLFISVLPFL
jgi:H/ACA ribonucleoprotein complex subunit 1